MIKNSLFLFVSIMFVFSCNNEIKPPLKNSIIPPKAEKSPVSFKKFNNISQAFSHFGFSLLILSILFNSILSSEIITNIKIGEKYDYNKSEIFFKKTEERKESNFKSIIAFFEIKDKNGTIIELKPEIRIYNQPAIITSEADIKTTLLSDKFIVINLVQNQEYFNVRYQVKPFMLWIWLSVLLVSFGGLVSFFKRNKHEK